MGMLESCCDQEKEKSKDKEYNDIQGFNSSNEDIEEEEIEDKYSQYFKE